MGLVLKLYHFAPKFNIDSNEAISRVPNTILPLSVKKNNNIVIFIIY